MPQQPPQTPWTPPPSRPGSVVGTTILTVLSGLFWLLLSLLQAAVFIGSNGQNTSVGGLAFWNLLLVAVYAWIAWGLWNRSPKALSWALWTHLLNAVLSGYQAFTDAPALIVVAPIHLAAFVFAMNARPHFKPVPPPEPIPAWVPPPNQPPQ